MRSKALVLGIIFTILIGTVLEDRAQARTSVNINLFYEELAPYGQWSPHQEFGYVWQPYEVGYDWKPYSNGKWAWSDQGWIWVSYEPYGWATYHYGRWIYDDYRGWLWIPGTTWAPAWVSWHQSPEYIGWSPLPPDRRFFIEIGFNFNSYKPYRYKPYYYKPYHYKHKHKKHHYYHHNYRPPARHCVFLPHHKFGHHKHAGKASVLNPQDAIVFRNSKNITNIKYSGNKVINYGPDKYFIEKRSNKKVVRHNIVDRKHVGAPKHINRVQGNTYNVYRPKIQRNNNRNVFIENRKNTNFHRSKGVNKKTSYKQDHGRINLNHQDYDKNDNKKRQYKNSYNNTASKKNVRISNPNLYNKRPYKPSFQNSKNIDFYETRSKLRKNSPKPNRIKSNNVQHNKFQHQSGNYKNKRKNNDNYQSRDKNFSKKKHNVKQKNYKNTSTRSSQPSSRGNFSRR